MHHESKLTAIILKKQPFNEADEIITFFTKEQGKVRALAKSVKLSKSKLQARLQMLFLVNIILAGGKLPKIISVEIVNVYEKLRTNLSAAKMAFLACELVIKFTADEQKNEPLFNLLSNFLNFLNFDFSEESLSYSLAKFKFEVLESAGLGVNSSGLDSQQNDLIFSPALGGFTHTKTGLGIPVSDEAYQIFLNLKNSTPPQNLSALSEVNRLLSDFIEFQLERKVKSEKYLE
jgi:DNA repair protein RecO (recombination protein O)